ncbi:MAG: tyrosine-type recombinase/integrase [Pseudomonadota bacterium]|nr:tyrosine-type recombinase/integrase [Pseudomonadota bacterium]
MARYVGKTMAEAYAVERAQAPKLALVYGQKVIPASPDQKTVRSLVIEYRRSPTGFRRLAPSTAKQWERHLSDIVKRFGDMPLAALPSLRAKRLFLAWRDERAATPRTADYAMTVLKRVMSWGKAHAIIEVNPVEKVEGIYRVNRAEQIVTDAELKSIIEIAPVHQRPLIKFASETGMRRGDIVRLKWDYIEDRYIQLETGKSRGRKRITVPITPATREVLEALKIARQQMIDAGKVPSAFVFVGETGLPFKENSVTQAWGRACTELAIDKHFHDLRGTAITRFVKANLRDDEIADIVGWERNRVEGIRKAYVDADAISIHIANQLEQRATAG